MEGIADRFISWEAIVPKTATALAKGDTSLTDIPNEIINRKSTTRTFHDFFCDRVVCLISVISGSFSLL